MKAQKGFTLVEILIVVVILGILAAIVIPQFTGASTEAKLSTMVNELQTMRSQIELYKLQHNEVLPDVASVGLLNAFITATDMDGDAWVAPATQYGPYMRKLPINPFNGLKDAAGNGTIREDTDLTTAGANTHSWLYNTTDGAICPDYVDADRDSASDGDEADY